MYVVHFSSSEVPPISAAALSYSCPISMKVVSLQSPRYPQPNAPISKHSKQVYCSVVHNVRGYPMSIIPVVICPYLPLSPTYEADNCIVVILSLFCIDCTWFKPLNRIFCQSSQLGTGLHCQFSRQLDH